MGLRILSHKLPLPLRVLGIILIKVVLILIRRLRVLVAPSPRPVPKVKCLTVHPVRRGHDLQQIAARNLYSGNLRSRKTNEIREKTADNRGVPNDQQILGFPLQLDEDWFESD